ncbi:MAG: hypothetical protein HYT87_04960 [Nitrospirae bacterium]|nr:hypothetical protein [Nitrospirota bacterium]
MAFHLVTLIFAGEVPTLNAYSQTWGDEFRISALTDIRQSESRREKGLGGSPLFRIVINLIPPFRPELLGSLASKIEESLVLPGSGQGDAVEIEIILPDLTEKILVRPNRYEDLESIRAVCLKLRGFVEPR